MPLSKIGSAGIEPESQYTGFKNRIINGAMMIDQRNAGASVTNSTGSIYTLDRWYNTTSGSNCTVQQVTGSTGNNKAIRVTGASGNATTQLGQKIEAVNIFDCASQSVTVSFTLYGSGSGSATVRFLYPTATDNYTSFTEPVAGTVINFTTTATQYSVTRTLDANANKGLWVIVERGATGAGVTWSLENFQLEKGSTATSFDYRPYGTELALCQRYLPVYSTDSNNQGTGIFGYWDASNNLIGNVNFVVQSRAIPTGVTATASQWNVNNSGTGNPTANSITFNGASLTSGTLNFTVASGGSSSGKAGRAYPTATSSTILFTGCEL